MKRSEMIEILTDLVLNKDTGFKLNEKEADLLLTEIESSGVFLPVNRHIGYYWGEEVDANKLFKDWAQDTSEILDDIDCYPDMQQKAVEEQIELPYNYEQTPDYLETIKWIGKGYCPCGDSNPETQAACSMSGCAMYKCESGKGNK